MSPDLALNYSVDVAASNVEGFGYLFGGHSILMHIADAYNSFVRKFSLWVSASRCCSPLAFAVNHIGFLISMEQMRRAEAGGIVAMMQDSNRLNTEFQSVGASMRKVLLSKYRIINNSVAFGQPQSWPTDAVESCPGQCWIILKRDYLFDEFEAGKLVFHGAALLRLYRAGSAAFQRFGAFSIIGLNGRSEMGLP